MSVVVASAEAVLCPWVLHRISDAVASAAAASAEAVPCSWALHRISDAVASAEAASAEAVPCSWAPPFAYNRGCVGVSDSILLT